MDLVFASDSIWNWEAERNFALLKDENPDLVRAAKTGHGVLDTEAALPASRRQGHVSTDRRRASLVVRGVSVSESKPSVQADEKVSVSHVYDRGTI